MSNYRFEIRTRVDEPDHFEVWSLDSGYMWGVQIVPDHAGKRRIQDIASAWSGDARPDPHEDQAARAFAEREGVTLGLIDP